MTGPANSGRQGELIERGQDRMGRVSRRQRATIRPRQKRCPGQRRSHWRCSTHAAPDPHRRTIAVTDAADRRSKRRPTHR